MSYKGKQGNKQEGIKLKGIELERRRREQGYGDENVNEDGKTTPEKRKKTGVATMQNQASLGREKNGPIRDGGKTR